MGVSCLTGIWELQDNWPYPKLFITDYFLLAITTDGTNLKLYEVTYAAGTWTATEKATLGVTANIVNVDVAGFGTYCLVTVNLGATKTVFQRTASTGAWASVAVTTIPGGASFCNYRGQLIVGSPYSTGAPWSTLPKCSIAWGDIGSTVMNPTDDIVAGFRHIPFDENGNNQVVRVLPLGDHCMVYGSAGVGIGKMVIVDKFPAMSFQEVSKIGVEHNYMVAGSVDKHLYLGRTNELVLVTAEGAKNLGYKNHMELLTGDDIILSYEPSRDRFFISDGSLCYVLTKHGLYSTHQCTTGVVDYQGELMGFVKTNSDTKIRLETTSFDAGIQGYKTIESVEAGLSYGLAVDGTLSTKYDFTGGFTSAPSVALNPKGMFTSKLTGREFKVKLEGNYDSTKDFQLSSLVCKVKVSDKTNIRGVYGAG